MTRLAGSSVPSAEDSGSPAGVRESIRRSHEQPPTSPDPSEERWADVVARNEAIAQESDRTADESLTGLRLALDEVRREYAERRRRSRSSSD